MPPTATADQRAYHRLKEQAADRVARLSRSGRDIGDIPPVADFARKSAATRSLQTFCESYLPRTFGKPWSPDHLKVIAKLQRAIKGGGLFSVAMPRGQGKTSLCLAGTLYAILTGQRRFVMLIGSCEEHATRLLQNLKIELSSNDHLLEDFPEAIYPIRRLENQARRAVGQLHHGKPTSIKWGAEEIALPTIPGSDSSGTILRVAGLTGNIRGAVHTLSTGEPIRPDLALLDDPQTDQSARSPSQCAARESIISGAVLGLAGPGQQIAAIMPCTVVRPNDLADRMLDPELHPEWQGERTKLVNSFPDNESLWDEYAEIRREGMRNGDEGRAATEFYREHRAEMDAGADVAWEARHTPAELSALQHAMNLKLADEPAFFAEYQNDPLPEEERDEEMLTADQIAAKTNGQRRGLAPVGTHHLTAFIDIQQKCLFYAVAAWTDDFTGYLIDYSTWPDQKRRHFTLRQVTRTLARAKPGAGFEGQLYHGLEQLTEDLLAREWRTAEGGTVKIERCLIDANWGRSTDTVYAFCRQSRHAAVLTPAHGRYVGASSTPFHEYKRKAGERVGHNWRIPTTAGKRAIRHVLFDANFWKSWLHARLATATGDRGAFTLYGHRPAEHRMLADQLTAETRTPTEAKGRIVDEWKLRPDRPDNHFLDCLVGAAVAASMQGAQLPGTQASPGARRKKLKLSDLQKEKRP